jgi:cation:H+ antiporter
VLAVALLLAGAEPEEAVTGVFASARGYPALAAGDAIGANAVILALALGLAALVAPLPVSRRVREYAGAAAVAGGLGFLALLDGRVSRWEGAGLVLAYALAVAGVWRRERTPPAIGELAELDDEGTRSQTSGLLLLLGGLALMVAGGWIVVQGAGRLTAILNVSESGIGLTVLALATSAEMLALVAAAARHRVAEVAVAGLVGSAAYNATVSLGLAALARPLQLSAPAPIVATAAATGVLPLVLVVAARSGQLPRPVGAVLVAGYVAAVPLLLR